VEPQREKNQRCFVLTAEQNFSELDIIFTFKILFKTRSRILL